MTRVILTSRNKQVTKFNKSSFIQSKELILIKKVLMWQTLGIGFCAALVAVFLLTWRQAASWPQIPTTVWNLNTKPLWPACCFHRLFSVCLWSGERGQWGTLNIRCLLAWQVEVDGSEELQPTYHQTCKVPYLLTRAEMNWTSSLTRSVKTEFIIMRRNQASDQHGYPGGDKRTI